MKVERTPSTYDLRHAACVSIYNLYTVTLFRVADVISAQAPFTMGCVCIESEGSDGESVSSSIMSSTISG